MAAFRAPLSERLSQSAPPVAEANQSQGKPAQRRIEDYALIGNCETAALVGRDGSIDWLCWPRFDSAACFAALLGGPEHGRWLIAPKGSGARVTRSYLDGSLILVTTFETESGAVELVYFMSPRDGVADLVRLVRGVSGRVEFYTEFILRFDYGFSVPWIERLDDDRLRAVSGPEMAVLHTPVPLQARISRPSLRCIIRHRGPLWKQYEDRGLSNCRPARPAPGGDNRRRSGGSDHRCSSPNDRGPAQHHQ
jgi:hypothetical protein